MAARVAACAAEMSSAASSAFSDTRIRIGPSSAGVVVQGQDRAEIRLTPAELGPTRIRVSLNAEDEAPGISAAHAPTPAAIESPLSSLTPRLADHGLRPAD